MAMIENIRKRRGFLIFIIGLGMLMFLIPYDAVMGLFGGTPGSESYGEFNGSTLTSADYTKLVKDCADSKLFENNAQGAQNTAWNNFSLKSVLGEDLAQANYQIGQEEFENIMFGNGITSWVKSVYYGGQEPTEDSRAGVESFFIGQDGVTKNAQFKLIATEYNKQKIEKLFKTGFYANTLDAEREYLNKNDQVKIDYVAVKYEDISDSLVTVTDGDIRSYFNKHKSDVEFKQRPFREVNILTYDVVATSSDSAQIKAELTRSLSEFTTETNDSSFVVNLGYDYSKQDYEPGTLGGDVDAQLVNGDAGTVVGPYIENGQYVYSKIVGKKDVVVEAKGRHIFLSAGFRETDSVNVIADSLKQLIMDGANFSSLASKWSADDTTSNSGGSLGWIKVEELGTEKGAASNIKRLITEAEKGETYVANVPGGFSVYQGTDFKYDGVRSVLSNMSTEIKALKETQHTEREKARKLSYQL